MDQNEEIMGLFGQSEDEQIENDQSLVNKKVLTPSGQKEYARSISSMRKLTNPQQDSLDAYEGSMNMPDLITQSHIETDAAIQAANDRAAAYGRELANTDNYMSAQEKYDMHTSIAQENDQREQLKTDPFGPAYMEALAEKMPNATEQQIKKYALNTAMQQDLAETVEQVGILETGWDMGKMLIPGRMDYNLSKLFGDSPIVGAWGAEDKLANMARRWKKLPVERQRAAWVPLKNEVLETMGPTEGAHILSELLNPMSNFDDYNNAWVGLDIGDLGLTVGGTAVGMAGIMARNNKIRRLGELGSKETAGAANVDVMRDPAKAEEFGVSAETAAGNGDPTDFASNIDASVYSGAAKETQARLYRIQKETDDILQGVKERSPIVSAFDEDTISNTITKREHQFQELYPQLEVGDVTTTRTGTNEFRTSGTFYDRKTGGSIKAKKSWRMTLNDNGEYTEVDRVRGMSLLNAPKYLIRKSRLATDDIQKSMQGENITQSMANDLSDLYGRAHSLLRGNPLSKKAKREEVDNALQEGDEWRNSDGEEVGKEFSYSELKDKGFTEDQVEYYYAMRQFSKSLGGLHNEIVRDKMVLNNVRNLTIPTKDSQITTFGTVYPDSASVNRAFSRGNDMGGDSSVREIYDTRTNTVHSIDATDFDEVYASGGKVARLEENPIVGADGRRFDRVIVHKNTESDLPAQVMKTKAGYLPRSYKKGVYANTFVRYGTLNGVPNRIVERKTMRIYDNQYEQAADIGPLIEKARTENGWNAGNQDSSAEWRLVSTDPREPLSYSGHAEATGGRMYTAPRSSQPIKFGSQGAEAERISPIESIQRQLGHLASNYPRHQHRMAVSDRIHKYAEMRRIPFDMNTPVQGTKEEHRFLEQMRLNYLQWAGMKTTEEAKLAKIMRDRYESMVGLKGVSRDSARARAAWSLIHATPIQRIRTANFHLMLGFFNPVQMFIQAQGGMIAASVLPANRVGKVAKGMPALITAMNIKDDAIGSKSLARALNTSEKSAKKVLEEYHATGFDNSVRSNADIQQVEQGIADPLAVMRKLGKYDTIFYAMGERFNRRLSWMVSLERHLNKDDVAARTGGDYEKMSRADWDAVRNDANTFMLSMHSANRARWQNGLLSLPTQFLQVQFKFLEEMMNLENGLTGSERARIGLMQVLMYGGASLPFYGTDVASYIGQWMGMSEEEARDNPALQGGMMQTFFHSMGVESDVSHRTALLSGIEDLWESIFGDPTTAETLSGPAASTASRAYTSFKEASSTMIGMAGQGNFNPLVYGKTAVEGLARLTSTYNQFEKAQLMYNMDNAIVNKYGETVDHVNWMTTFGQLIGFTPSATQKVWDTKERIATEKSLEKKAEEQLGIAWMARMRATSDTGKQQADAQIWAILNSYVSSPAAQRRILRKLHSNMVNPTTEAEKTMNDWYKLQQQKSLEGLTADDEE